MGQYCCKGSRKVSVIEVEHSNYKAEREHVIDESTMSTRMKEVQEAPEEVKRMEEFKGLAPRRMILARV
eukprot:m.33171 g.33171  ORF g.33171 m.33171 type:complete len:69 (-) comp6436_c3_seq2:621-827(-)